MYLKNHIVRRLLVDKTFIMEVIETHMTHEDPKYRGENVDREVAELGLYELLRPEGNKTYLITKTVLDKLDLFDTKKAMSIEGWKVFESLPDFKKTFILPDNRCIRIKKDDGVIHFVHFTMTPDKTRDNFGQLYWVMLFVNLDENRMADHFNSADGNMIAPFLYALLCFVELTDNEEVIVPPGRKYGTVKSGKVINIFPEPITIVNSRWNVKTIRTDGFPVSGHVRLQPFGSGTDRHYKLIYIEPYMKTGYTKRAGKDLQA